MERAERIIALGVGLLFDSVLIAVLWLMLALTLVTAVQRFVKVWQQASVRQAHCRRRAAGRRGAPLAPPSAPGAAASARAAASALRPPAWTSSPRGTRRRPPSPAPCPIRSPRRGARALGRVAGHLATERRAQVERNLRRVDPTLVRRSAPPPRRRDLRELRPLLRGVVPAARHQRGRPRRRLPGRRLRAPRRGDGQGQRRHHGHAPPRRVGVVRVLGDAGEGLPRHRRGRGARAPRPLRVVRRAAPVLRVRGRRPRARRRRRHRARAQGEPRARPALRPRPLRHGSRGRVLRRAHHAARRARHPRAAHRRADPAHRRSTSTGPTCRRGVVLPAARHHAPGQAPRRRPARHPGPRPRARGRSSERAPEQWHLLQPNWPSDRPRHSPAASSSEPEG